MALLTSLFGWVNKVFRWYRSQLPSSQKTPNLLTLPSPSSQECLPFSACSTHRKQSVRAVWPTQRTRRNSHSWTSQISDSRGGSFLSCRRRANTCSEWTLLKVRRLTSFISIRGNISGSWGCVGKSSCCSSPEKVRRGREIVRDTGISMLGGGRTLERNWVSENGPEEQNRKIQRETHVGVVDGDVGMQGLHICVLQPLYLELVLHVGPVYRSPTELRSRSGQSLCSVTQITIPK